MEFLGLDAFNCVLSYLDLKSFCALQMSQRSLYSLCAYDEAAWRAVVTRESRPELRLSTDPTFSVRKCGDVKQRLWTPLALRSPKSFVILVLQHFKHAHRVQLQGEAESSHDYDQDINRTVLSLDGRFWSSIGAPVRDSNDWLRYRLSEQTLIFWIGVRLFRAGYQGGVLYPPQQYRIKIGQREQSWDYVSEPVTAASSESMQYLLVLPALVIGKFVEVELIGKQQTQESDNLYYVAIESVICAGLPAALFAEVLDVEVQPTAISSDLAISASNCDKWIEEFTRNPDIVQRESLEMLNELGKIREYFESVTNTRSFNKIESYYFIESLEPNEEVKLLQLQHCTPSEDLGDLLYERGSTRSALIVFHRLHIVRKMMKCLLKLGEFHKCMLLSRYQHFDQPTLPETIEIARSISEEVASNFEAYLRTLEPGQAGQNT